MADPAPRGASVRAVVRAGLRRDAAVRSPRPG